MKPSKIVKLKAGEDILAVVHEDLAPSFPKLVILFVWFVLPFFFLFPLLKQGTIGLVIFLLLVFSALIFIVRFFIKWGNTALVITDRRIVDINQKALFDKEITETPFSMIDEVSYRVRGILPTVFKLGIIRLKTTGQSADIEFSRVRQPQRIHDLINDLRNVVSDDVIDSKVKKVKELADKMSVEELEEIRSEIHGREVDEAAKTIFVDDEDNPFLVKRK